VRLELIHEVERIIKRDRAGTGRGRGRPRPHGSAGVILTGCLVARR
jgi:hypothetical protein